MAWIKGMFRRTEKYKYRSPIYKGPDLFNGCLMPEKSLMTFERWLVSNYSEEILKNNKLESIVNYSDRFTENPREETLFIFLYWKWVALN